MASRVPSTAGGITGLSASGDLTGRPTLSSINTASQVSSQTLANANGGTANVPRAFLQRDYRQGVAIRFMTDFPQELQGRIDPNAFEYTMKEINAMFEEAENFDCSTFCESCVGFLTANLIWLCRDSKYERALKRVTKFIADQNQRVYLPNGLFITDPVQRGLRCIEINVLEPQRS